MRSKLAAVCVVGLAATCASGMSWGAALAGPARLVSTHDSNYLMEVAVLTEMKSTPWMIPSDGYADCRSVRVGVAATIALNRTAHRPTLTPWSLADVYDGRRNLSRSADSASGNVVTCDYAASVGGGQPVFVEVQLFGDYRLDAPSVYVVSLL